MYSPNNRFIPQALITLMFSLPGLIMFKEGLFAPMMFYFVTVVFIFANALSNVRYFANIEPLDLRWLKRFFAKRINTRLPNNPPKMDKAINEDVKASLKFVDLLIDGTILAALFPSFRNLADTIAENGSAAEIALSALVPLLMVVAFVYMVYSQTKKGK